MRCEEWVVPALCNGKSCPLHTLVAGLLARSRYPEGPATGHLGTGFYWFRCVYKRMRRWFRRFQIATACFLCSPPDLNFLDPYSIFMYVYNNHCHRVTAHLQLIISIIIIIIIIIISFMQGIFTYIPETNYIPREYSVAGILLLLFMVLILLLSVLNLLYCTFTLVLSEVCVQCPIWPFSVVP